ncbi:MAG: TadE family type IV pilus minor pilin [Jatrophihabitantaceae bacterium]
MAARLRCFDERGMVTAETAVVLPVLVLLSLAGIAAVGVAQARVRCADAALVAARAIARGDPAAADSLAHAAAGPAVRVSSSALGADTVVTARLPLRQLRWLGSVTIVEMATVATEPAMPP